MSDLIHRADLFNKLANIKTPPEANEYKAEVYGVIQALPAAETQQGGWILTSEKTPEYMVDMWDEGVTATVEGREGNIIYRHGVVPDAWFEDGEWYIDGVKLENAIVTAWMPHPDPYIRENK